MMDLKSKKLRSLARVLTASTHKRSTEINFIKQDYQSHNYNQSIYHRIQHDYCLIALLTLIKRLITLRFQHNKMRALRQYSLRKAQARSKKPTNSVGRNSAGLEELLSLRTPAVASQQLTSYKNRVEDIKQEIHKLRTESPQLSLNTSPNSLQSKSFFLSYPRSKKGQQLLGSFIEMVNKRNPRPSQKSSYLPKLSSSSTPLPQNQQDSQVVSLRRQMRYRLSKVPVYRKEEENRYYEKCNASLSGWKKNPEDFQDLSRNGLY